VSPRQTVLRFAPGDDVLVIHHDGPISRSPSGGVPSGLDVAAAHLILLLSRVIAIAIPTRPVQSRHDTARRRPLSSGGAAERVMGALSPRHGPRLPVEEQKADRRPAGKWPSWAAGTGLEGAGTDRNRSWRNQ
jgi:hypothetical protein